MYFKEYTLKLSAYDINVLNLSVGSNEKGFTIGKDMLCAWQILQSVSIQDDNMSPSFNFLRFCGFVTVDLLNYMSKLFV